MNLGPRFVTDEERSAPVGSLWPMTTVVYFHGWPDGSTDTSTLARALREEGVDLVEIQVTTEQLSSYETIVHGYLEQVPNDDDDLIFIGYCGAGRYSLIAAQHLADQGRPPKAILLVDALIIEGGTLLHLSHANGRPPSMSYLRQVDRLVPPINESPAFVLKDVISVRLAVRSRIRSLLHGSLRREEPPAEGKHDLYQTPLVQRFPPNVQQPVFLYNQPLPPGRAARFGPGGLMVKYLAGPVAIRTFLDVDHRTVIAQPHVQRVARAIADDVNALVTESPVHLMKAL